MKLNLLKFAALLTLSIGLASCHTVDDQRLPNMPVNISIADAGMWNTFGVSGFGSNRNFILLTTGEHIPASFPFNSRSATGFGGVLLIEGLDPFTLMGGTPLAYDLACPVERQADIRVFVEPETYYAVCPVCGSVYDVTLGMGAPVAGPAATGKYKYGLKNYSCLPSGSGGYYITN